MATISLCMIVKNEEKVLGRCLDCVKGFADEIIIVDTGSEDRTKEIAAGYTDRIYDFTWRDDFAAARNFAFSKAKMEYSMWLDADDVIQEEEQEKIRLLKDGMTPDVSAVMMKYVTAFDDSGKPAFIFERERIIRTDAGYQWAGRVHEVIDLSKRSAGIGTKGDESKKEARVLHSDAVIEHHSAKSSYSERNLQIYETMLREGEILNPRNQFYYGRELYYHGHNEKAVEVFRKLLDQDEEPAWVENLADACRFLAVCLNRLGRRKEALESLLHTLTYGVPRPNVCCDIGAYFMKEKRYAEAEYWYRQAMTTPYVPNPGAFLEPDHRQYTPAIQLTVCLDRQGRHEEAERFNELAASYRPNDASVKQNRAYFGRLKQKKQENG